MAISKDTAAIVAANLTVAWAIRIGTVENESLALADGAILNTYFKFRGLVSETSLAKK